MPYTLADLKIARRHLADAERQIVKQEMLITRLRIAGLSTDDAESVLAKFHVALHRLRDHHAQVQAAIEARR